VLYEQCVEEPLATVTGVETKPTTKWYVPLQTEYHGPVLIYQETTPPDYGRITTIRFEAFAYDPKTDLGRELRGSLSRSTS